jgi:hypothetical protein
MKELVITKVQRSDSLPEGKGGFIDVETSAGPRQIRFTYEDAERLAAALETARRKIQSERVAAGKPPLADKPKSAVGWDTAVNPVSQVAVISARFADGTTQQLEIPRNELAAIIESLRQALQRFEAGAEMRQ